MDEEDIQEMTASLAAAEEFSVDLYGGLNTEHKVAFRQTPKML